MDRYPIERLVRRRSWPASVSIERWIQHAHALLPDLPLFESLVLAAKHSGVIPEATAAQIEADLPRTHVNSLIVPEEDQAAHWASINRLLLAWCVLRPEIGYTQSMNFIAAVALGICGHDEEAAFLIFAALITRLPADFFSASPPLQGFHIEV